jgi:hypothetical protein
MLVSPAEAEPLHARIYLPDTAPARRVTFQLDGKSVYSQSISPGIQRIVTPPLKPAGTTSMVSLQVDRTFSAPGDSRVLGVSLFEIGWGK